MAGAAGRPAWSFRAYDFERVDGPAPPSVNPSLWRQAQLNNTAGLFKVIDRVYQLRGFDLSNMNILEGDTGLVLMDPLDHRRDRPRRARAVLRAPAAQAGRRGDLHPQPR